MYLYSKAGISLHFPQKTLYSPSVIEGEKHYVLQGKNTVSLRNKAKTEGAKNQMFPYPFLIRKHWCQPVYDFCMILHENDNLLRNNDQSCAKTTNFSQKRPILRNYEHFDTVSRSPKRPKSHLTVRKQQFDRKSISFKKILSRIENRKLSIVCFLTKQAPKRYHAAITELESGE